MEENEGLLKSILKSFSKQEGLDDLLAMSEHRDGFKRENAVRRLGMLGNPVAIPKLIVRANDWVPQVRSAARTSLFNLMKSGNAEAFIHSLPEIYHLQDCGRDDHSTLISDVTSYLLLPENVKYIKDAITSEDRYLARIATSLCIENSILEKQDLVSKCLFHHDVIVRNIASNLLREFSGEVLNNLLEIAIKDTFMPIRREAFQIYLKAFPEKGLEIARMFLFDNHISIREIAIKKLTKNQIDIEGILLTVLISDGQSALKIRCAILGLAEIGSKSSILTIKNLTENVLPSIRRASIQALVKLIGEDARSYLQSGLKDKSPNVAKESSRLIQKLGLRLSVGELIEIVDKACINHTLTVCISIAKRINKWDRLMFLLGMSRILKPLNEGKLELIEKELTNWNREFNRSSSQPTKTKIEGIVNEYNKYLELSGGRRHRLLEFTIKSFGI